MKKIIVLPLKYNEIREVYTDAFFVLFDRLCDTYGFEFVFADSLKGMAADLFLIQAGVHGKKLIKESTSLSSDTKVILYLDGMHAFPRSSDMMASALARADYLLSSGVDEGFRNIWPEYIDKFEVFPTFFAPHVRYIKQRFNEKPLRRCLFSGNTTQHYPLRALVKTAFVNDDPRTKRIDMMKHPRWKTPHKTKNVIPGVMGDDYAKALNHYFCSFTGLSKNRGAVAKYFQIPATGALLIAEDSLDVRGAGFVADKNYVSVNELNVFNKINQCLDDPEAYRDIRLEGMELVRAKHSVENRVRRIGKIIEML